MRVLYIDIDSLRADHLGCYGYHRNTSPNIDSLARDGVRFTNYYTSDAPCLPSRTALMSGMQGIHTGVVGHGGSAADMRIQGETRGFRCALDADCLPRVFRDAGCHTALFSPFGERHSIYTFYAGFNEIHNTGSGGMESAEQVTPGILKWIEDNAAAKDDWFMYVNYWDPHTPYRAPEDFGNPFENDPLPAWLTDEVHQAQLTKCGPHSPWDFGMYNGDESPKYPRNPGTLLDRAGLRKTIDGYDTGVRYADHHVGLILDALRAQGVFDDVCVIISADHGENQGELGIYGEHGTADQGTCNIPLIIKWDGCKAGHVDDALHYNVDLLPTFAELVGRKPRAIWDGLSFASTVTQGTDAGRDYLVISQCCHVCQRSVRFGDYLYIRTYHDGYHLFPTEMLYNIAEDPHELHNLAETRRDLVMQAVYHLNEWHDNAMRTMPYGYTVDPLWTVMQETGPFHAMPSHLPPYVKRLEETGRAWAIPELKKRHPEAFPADAGK